MYNNPWNIAAIIMTFIGVVIMAIGIFSADAQGGTIYRISPHVVCFEFDTKEEMFERLDQTLSTVELVDRVEPYEGYDGFILYITRDMPDLDRVFELRWKGKLMCEKFVASKPTRNT